MKGPLFLTSLLSSPCSCAVLTCRGDTIRLVGLAVHTPRTCLQNKNIDFLFGPTANRIRSCRIRTGCGRDLRAVVRHRFPRAIGLVSIAHACISISLFQLQHLIGVTSYAHNTAMSMNERSSSVDTLALGMSCSCISPPVVAGWPRVRTLRRPPRTGSGPPSSASLSFVRVHCQSV